MLTEGHAPDPKCKLNISSFLTLPHLLHSTTFSSTIYLFYFSRLILSLPLLGLGSKSGSLSPGFCVCRPSQFDMICLELNLEDCFNLNHSLGCLPYFIYDH